MGPATIKIDQIRENPVALRTVNRTSEEYLQLVESIKVKGILNPPSVRAKKDPETGKDYFELIDGLHRYTAAKDAGRTEMPVNVLDFNDAEVLEAQIIANLHVIKTPPSQYTKQVKRILTMNPLMTEMELAKKLGTSLQFIQQRLSLTSIENKEILKLVDDSKIPLANAYGLARLPEAEQADYVERALTMKPDEFLGTINTRLKEIKEAHRQGKGEGAAKFEAVAHCQKVSDIKQQLADGTIAKHLIRKHSLSAPLDAFNMALKWVLHLDPESVDAQLAKYNAQNKARDEQKAKKMQEKAAKAEAEAKKLAAEAAAAAKKIK